MSETTESSLLRAPANSSAASSYSTPPQQRQALTFPALVALYTDERLETRRLREKLDRKRAQLTRIAMKQSVHAAYVYRLAHAITLLLEGKTLEQSSIPSAIPENCRGDAPTTDALMNHLDALITALEYTVIRTMSATVSAPPARDQEPATPTTSPLELIRTDAEATLAASLSALSFQAASMPLSPLTITE